MTKKEFAKLLFEKGVFTTRTEAEKKVGRNTIKI